MNRVIYMHACVKRYGYSLFTIILIVLIVNVKDRKAQTYGCLLFSVILILLIVNVKDMKASAATERTQAHVSQIRTSLSRARARFFLPAKFSLKGSVHTPQYRTHF